RRARRPRRRARGAGPARGRGGAVKHSVVRRKLGKVDRALEKAVDGTEIPGACVLARIRGDGEVLEYRGVRGHAVLQPERIAMAPDTVFDLASLTKVMATTTAVMLLAERGGLALEGRD